MEAIVKRRNGLRVGIIALLVAMIGLTTVVAYVFWAGTISGNYEVSAPRNVQIGTAGDVTTIVDIDNGATSVGRLIPGDITRRLASDPGNDLTVDEVHFIDFVFDVEWLPSQDTINAGMAGALDDVEGRLYVSVPTLNIGATPFRSTTGRVWNNTATPPAFEPSVSGLLFDIYLLNGTTETLIQIITPGPGVYGTFVDTITAMDVNPTEVTLRVRMNQPMNAAMYNQVRDQIAQMAVRFQVTPPVVVTP